jgi:hypothetical protein
MKSIASILALTAAVPVFASDIVLFDFEGDDPLAGWRNEGGAFHAERVPAAYYKDPVAGTQGARFLCFFDFLKQTRASVGTLLSPVFTIERDYINFTLGGSRGWPDQLGVELMVDGKVVRGATGSSARPGLPFKMPVLHWDVREFSGRKARLRFNDRSPCGMLCADHFVQSDQPGGYRCDAAARWREMYRPAFHATTGTGRSGDANGMFYYNGVWHLGFQLYYVGAGGTSWGRTLGTDLVHWRQTADTVPVGSIGTAASGGATMDHLNTSGLNKTKILPFCLLTRATPRGRAALFLTPP